MDIKNRPVIEDIHRIKGKVWFDKFSLVGLVWFGRFGRFGLVGLVW